MALNEEALKKVLRDMKERIEKLERSVTELSHEVYGDRPDPDRPGYFGGPDLDTKRE